VKKIKHGKKPTLKQKIRIKNYGLNPDNWLVVKDCSEVFELVHRQSRKIRRFKKEVNSC